METTFFLKSLSLFHCVPLYVCRLCINFQDLCVRLLGMAALRILLLTFISCFVIDFLSIRKVIIFSAIATDDRHPRVVLLDHFYLLISLEGMSTFIRSRASFQDQIWDVHLYNV